MKRTSLLLFLAVFAALLLFAPYSIRSMGYASEEIDATRAFLSPHTVFRGGLELPAMRHGLVPVIMEMPFLAPITFLHIATPQITDVAASLQPIVFTSLIGLLMYVWSVSTGAGRKRAAVLTILSIFATMLWPYAYIGLETTQSLLLLLLAYLAIAATPRRSWTWFLCFAALAALAASAKSTSTFLFPAIAYLCAVFVGRCEAAADELRKQRFARIGVFVVVILGFFAVNYHIESLYWKALGGRQHFFEVMLLHDPLTIAINGWSFFGSPNKSLFWFAPLTIFGVAALPRRIRERSPLAIFALLTLLGLVGGFSLLRIWADETWGPRYLHSAIAPLLLLWIANREERTHQSLVAIVSLAGVIVSFLGCLFYYGELHQVQLETQQATLEATQHDPVWNHIAFNARLAGVWMGIRSPEWQPFHKWWTYGPPPLDFRGWHVVNLTSYSTPQPLILRKLR